METIQNLLDKGEIVYKKNNDVPMLAVMMVSHASSQNLLPEDDHYPEEADKIENSSDASVVVPNPSLTKEASTSTLVVAAEECLPPLPKEEIIYDVIKHMSKVLALVSMFDALCMFATSWSLLEHALAEVAAKHGGAQTFFKQFEGVWSKSCT